MKGEPGKADLKLVPAPDCVKIKNHLDRSGKILYSVNMKTRTKVVITAFSFVVFFLAVFVFVRKFFFNDSEKNIHPQVITPNAQEDSEVSGGDGTQLSDSTMHTSFVPLFPSETLMSTLTLDFDGDAFDDQIIVVRKAGSPYLFLIIGLYNSETNSYDRSAEISTEISKIRTFSYNGIDMIGNHRTALVYQGIKTDGDTVLNMYLCKKKRGVVELQNIGSFSSDGTIFIQQTERTEAYELSQSQGKSYTVWVYSSDKTESNTSTGITQIQTEYSWNPDKETYVQTNQLKITGNRLAAKELARIQNGNVETFARFLSGLWYKTSNNSSRPSYIYFDYENREVILLSDETEGVYSWEDSSLRRSGIYLTTVNSIISSMKRRFDIMLSGVNEAYIHVKDDVGNMVIKESNQWDGTYRKMSFQNVFGEDKTVSVGDEYLKVLSENKIWVDENGNKYSFNRNAFKILTENGAVEGIFAVDTVGAFPVIQFRSYSDTNLVLKAYAMKFRTEEITIPPKTKKQKPTVDIRIHKDEILFTPVRLSPDTVYAAEGKSLTLKKE